jgi:hypothetical protein
MHTEDILIDKCKAMGYGVDILFRTGETVVIQGRKHHKFKSVNEALKWVNDRQTTLKGF